MVYHSYYGTTVVYYGKLWFYHSILWCFFIRDSPCYAYASRGKNWLIAIMYESRLSRHIQSYFMCNIILLCEYHFPISKQTAEFYIAVTLSILTTHLDVIRGR